RRRNRIVAPNSSAPTREMKPASTPSLETPTATFDSAPATCLVNDVTSRSGPACWASSRIMASPRPITAGMRVRGYRAGVVSSDFDMRLRTGDEYRAALRDGRRVLVMGGGRAGMGRALHA